MSDRSAGICAPLVATLELIATEHPELLPWQIDVVHHSPARWMVHQLAAAWGVRPLDLGPLAVKAARDLDRLEARRGGWRHACRIVHEPCLAALLDLAVERRERIDVVARRRRLESIARRLAKELEAERQRRWIQRFIGVAATESPQSTSEQGQPGRRTR